MKLKFIFLILAFLSVQNCIITLFGPGGQDPSEMFEFVLGGTDKDKIVIIPIEGVITEKADENFFGVRSDSIVSRVKEQLKRIEFDKSVKGVILKINSPGGTVTASDIIYSEIKKFKIKNDIPVISVFMDTAASGAYYIAMATDFLGAHPTTVTGSIGVILQGFNVKEGLEKIGVKDQSFASGINKSIGSSTREMTPDQRKILQSVVDDLYSRFFRIVKEGRPGVGEENLRMLADGRIFTSEQAQKVGLVDRVGYFEEFVSDLMKRKNYRKSHGNNNPRLIIYSSGRKVLKNIYQARQENPSVETIADKILGDPSARFMYLWSP